MAIQYNFLAPIDQKVRDQGYDFVSQDKYLQDGFKSTDGISYEGDGSPVSYANSGIMSGYMTPFPIIYPPIREGGGGGPPGPADPGSYDSQFDPITQNKEFVDDIGEGTIAEEDDDEGSLGIIDGLRAIGAFALGGPFNAGFSINRSLNRNKQKEIDKINAAIEAQYGPSDPGSRGRDDTPGFGKTAAGNYTNQFEGGDPGQDSPSTGRGREEDDKMAKGGRAGYFFGGRVNYKVGGRTDAESQYGAGSVGSYDSSANQSDRGQSYGNNNPPVSTRNDNKIVTTDFISKGPNLTIDYTDPRNYTSLYGKIGFNNILDNDDLTAEGNVTGEFGPIGYNTNFTDQGITGTNLTAGNFNADISPDMQVQNIGYNNNINGINYGVNTDFDNTMFTAGVNFKNGGLASIL